MNIDPNEKKAEEGQEANTAPIPDQQASQQPEPEVEGAGALVD